jgi:putative ABC transport system substrate-binding protein
MQRRTFIGGSAAILADPLFSPDAGAEQPTKRPVIGFLIPTDPGQSEPNVAAFREGLRETGYVEAQNVAIEYRWAEGRQDQLPALAADLVTHNVDVIAVTGDAATLAAKRATATIPIVFFSGGDPVATGLVASLARPGGNLTGVGVMVVELIAKRFELISEFVPHAKVIGLLLNPNDPNAERFIREGQETTQAKNLELQILRVSTDNEIGGVFASLVHVGALVVALFRQREQLVAMAARHAVPAINPQREFVDAGGLFSYGSSVIAAVRQLGVYAGKILKGAKPADLPVQQPTTFELVINLKTAKALGLTVPPSILARADEVIE